MTTNQKLAALREKMKAAGVTAYVALDADPHLSEYLPEYYKERRWLSGFTGSAGTVVVTAEKSGLWTDGRYYIQAEKQLSGSEIALYRMADVGVISVEEFLAQELEDGQVIGFNGKCMTTTRLLALRELLEGRDVEIRTDLDLIGALWTEGRPPVSDHPALLHPARYSGRTTAEKLADVRGLMQKKRLDYYIAGSLDSVDWLCNIRGRDVVTSPLVAGYVLVSQEEATLFAPVEKITDEVRAYLLENGMAVAPYEDIYTTLPHLLRQTRVGVDGDRVNAALYSALPRNTEKVITPDLCCQLKAVKNPAERAEMRRCHLEDGAAVVRFLIWLRKNVGEGITEQDVVLELARLRGERIDYTGPSFDTIAAYQSNAAMMHYKPAEAGSAKLEPRGFLLVDSGGQYLGGTTDITRTMALGPITNEQRRDFTLVLQSFIALHAVRFLEGSTGKSLDILARKVMWDNDLNYKCGTGHGVGSYLNVHEGPNNFSNAQTALEEGMVITIEPGVYKEGRYGIRTENQVLVVRDRMVPDVGVFYRFEALTQCPIDTAALDTALLSKEEINWLNGYHRGVYENLLPLLTPEEAAWLKEATKPIPAQS